MKKYFSLIIAIAITTFWIQAPAFGSQTTGLKITIGIKDNKTEITPDQDFILTVRYRNTSTNETFTMYSFNDTTLEPFGGIGVTIVSPSGKDISPHYNPGSGSGAFIHIAPQETKNNEIKLSDFIKLTEAGKYTITARKTYMLGQQTKETTSNSLTISVVSRPK